jgi:hypothetical protein
MSLKQRVLDDIKAAMKAGDTAKLVVLRGINSAFSNKLIEQRAVNELELSDETALKVLMSEAKKRRDSIEAFKQAKRDDLAEKEQAELLLIQQYLPSQLSDSETKTKIEQILAQHPEADTLPLAMKIVMQELKGQADGKLISDAIKQKFNA